MFARIVVGTDGSETAKQAVREATELAKFTGATLDVVSAFEPVASSRLREERLQASEMAEEIGVANVKCHAREGDPADAILDVAEEQGADLIVVGNKGMTGAKRFLLGSVPNKVSHHAPCSVLIVRTT